MYAPSSWQWIRLLRVNVPPPTPLWGEFVVVLVVFRVLRLCVGKGLFLSAFRFRGEVRISEGSCSHCT